MHGSGGIDCDFCDPRVFRDAELLIESPLSFFASRAFGTEQVLPGGGIIVPRAHRESPFDLTEDEWSDTHELLRLAKSALDEWLRPDGYNLIWNIEHHAGQEVAHVHLHVLPPVP